MMPQTYNNFVGTQGSKPSIELVHGVGSRFNVNLTWLLYGKGAVFLDQENALSELPTGIRRRMMEGLRQVKSRQFPLLEGLTQILSRFFEIDPAGAIHEVDEFIRKLKASMRDAV